MLEDVEPVVTLPPGAAYRKVLVPMKLGEIGEEMVATAVALAKERGATSRRSSSSGCRARSRSRARLPEDVRQRAEESLAEARAIGEDNGVEVVARTIVARSIGHAIVDEARDAAPT